MPSRLKIVEAAADVFASRGYYNPSTKEIADRAGVNEATLFRKFGSKKELGRAVAKHVTAWYQADKPPKAMLDPNLDFPCYVHLVATWIADHFSNRFIHLQANMRYEFAAEMEYSQVEMHKHFIHRIALEQQKGGVIAGDPALMAAALIYCIYGMSAVRAFKIHPTRNANQTHVSLFSDMWLRSVCKSSLATEQIKRVDSHATA